MSLNKKILLSFFISASIFAALVAFELYNFVQIKSQIKNLELTDTIRSKTLQLRRHEKNYFLYSSQQGVDESKAVYDYIGQITKIIDDNIASDQNGDISRLKGLIGDYSHRFARIQRDVAVIRREMAEADTGEAAKYMPLVELTLLEQPLKAAEILEARKVLKPGSHIIDGMRGLDVDIKEIRRTGEEIINVSKDLDKIVRASADRSVYISQVAILGFFPVFLLAGMGSLFYFIRSIKGRLESLMDAIEQTGKGPEPYHELEGVVSAGGDEVDLLISKFNQMERELAQREDELGRKNRELSHARKLASIGTLASGVAHELNNPLNNIYVSAQVLEKEAGDDANPVIKEVVGDIVGQTMRVKRIVGDLLEFARGREPVMKRFELTTVIKEVHRLLSTTNAYNMERVRFTMTADGPAVVFADPEQVERVFINLFTNAVEAMEGRPGEIDIRMRPDGTMLIIEFADNGPGIDPAGLDSLFEPFYTTKDKGTGLGLSIVFNIIQKHGGGIVVDSEVGKGTVFTITLPVG